MIYELYTFVDITETRIYHGFNDLKKYQQQNFNTIVQTIGLCGNVYYENTPIVTTYDNKKAWYFEWKMEIDDLFKRDNDHIAILPELFQFVPFIQHLTEEVSFEIPVFEHNKNIFFNYKKPYGLRREI